MNRFFIALLISFLSSSAFSAANDFIAEQRNSTDTAPVKRILPSPATDGVLVYDTSTLLPKWVTLGAGLSINPSDELEASAGGSVDWSDLTGKPVFSAVATSGSYDDLSDKPEISAAISRSLAIGQAYQCTDIARACMITLSVKNESGFTLSGTGTSTGVVTVGGSAAVDSGVGVNIMTFGNEIGGALAVGVSMNSALISSGTLIIPVGHHFAVRKTAGSGMSIVSAFEQQL